MTSTTLKVLLQPINNTKPAGEDIRADTSNGSLYYQIKDARLAARNAERQLLRQEGSDDGLTHWEKVHKLAVDILTHTSKDLEVCAWFTEALLRLQHFSGLALGFAVAEGIVNHFWPNCYPLADEDGIESKIMAFTGLNGEDSSGSLILPIRNQPLTGESNKGSFTLWQYQRALKNAVIDNVQQREKLNQDTGFSLADIKQAVEESGIAFYQQLVGDVCATQDNFNALNAAFTEKCAEAAPPTSAIKDILMEIADHVHFLLQDSSFKENVPVDMANSTVITKVTQIGKGTATGKRSAKKEKKQILRKAVMPQKALCQGNNNMQAVQNREQALNTLREVANFFSDTEPHSPIPYVLSRAIYWGSLTLPELLQELIEDDEPRSKFCKLAGITMEIEEEEEQHEI